MQKSMSHRQRKVKKMGTDITEEKEEMTSQEAEKFLKELGKVFSIVRLLDKENFDRLENHFQKDV